jgi:hypothetical protein
MLEAQNSLAWIFRELSEALNEHSFWVTGGARWKFGRATWKPASEEQSSCVKYLRTCPVSEKRPHKL